MTFFSKAKRLISWTRFDKSLGILAGKFQNTLAKEQPSATDYEVLRHERDALRHECDALRRQAIQSGERIAKLETDVEHLKVTRFEAKRECHSMKTSLSWRLTWPLRLLRDTMYCTSTKNWGIGDSSQSRDWPFGHPKMALLPRRSESLRPGRRKNCKCCSDPGCSTSNFTSSQILTSPPPRVFGDKLPLAAGKRTSITARSYPCSCQPTTRCRFIWKLPCAR